MARSDVVEVMEERVERHSYPLLEYDPARQAVVDPDTILPIGLPERCVLCNFPEVVRELKERGEAKPTACEIDRRGTLPAFLNLAELLEMTVDGQRLAVYLPGAGAPIAAAHLEELIALGCRKFIRCDGCGVLDREIACGDVLVPSAAIRDEGTSYHYLPPGREVAATPAAFTAVLEVLRRRDVAHQVCKVWTTDAFYRETPEKVAHRRSEGCLAVEMEAAAQLAVAWFRGAELALLLYGGDDISSGTHDLRDGTRQFTTREKLFWWAVEACLNL